MKTTVEFDHSKDSLEEASGVGKERMTYLMEHLYKWLEKKETFSDVEFMEEVIRISNTPEEIFLLGTEKGRTDTLYEISQMGRSGSVISTILAKRL